MDCQETEERLPWLLNGALEPDERAAVEIHLASCARCAAGYRETHAMAALLDEHPGALDLVAFVEGGTSLAGLRAHLEYCRKCAAEVELVRQSREAVKVSQPTRRRWVRWALPVAACLALVAAAATWFTRQRELNQLRADNTTLRNQIQGAVRRSPSAGAQMVDLFGEGRLERSQGGASPVAVTARADAVLLLNPSGPGGCQRCRIEIQTGDGTVVWSASEVPRNPAGEIAVSLPAGFLSPRSYLILVLGGNAAPERYRFEIR